MAFDNQKQRIGLDRISGEYEFNLSNTTFNSFQNQLRGSQGEYEVMGEVNPVHMFESTVSLADSVDDLNNGLRNQLLTLSRVARNSGGDMYGGSKVFEEVSEAEPKWYRTTALSENLARNFLDISGLQIVMGMNGDEFGVEALNYLNSLHPVFVGMSASSPYQIGKDGELEETGYLSSRIGLNYSQMRRELPDSMFKSKTIGSLQDYRQYLLTTSKEVRESLESRLITDTNWEELLRDREGGAYFPFETLEPHQVYWMNRLREDHANESSEFTIEMRAFDMPTRLSRIQALQSFTMGLMYCAHENGFDELPQGFDLNSEFELLDLSSKEGLNLEVNGKTIRDTVEELLPFAEVGLHLHNCDTSNMELEIERLLSNGSCAEELIRRDFTSKEQIKNHLIDLFGEDLV